MTVWHHWSHCLSKESMVTTTPVRGDTPTPPPPPPRRSLLERAAGFAQRHRWTALLLWVVVLFAVCEGLAHTGSVVTAAGAIMIAVFGAFMLGGDRMLQQFGFGMVVAVFVDAVVIRCLIVPAALQLMGRHAWWIPAGLDRRMPRLDIEKHD
ncbi:hypothetical protein SHIRM173S_10662 [Streptomyces hirsutus]